MQRIEAITPSDLDRQTAAFARFLAMCYNNRSTLEKGRNMIPEVIDLSKRMLERTQSPSLARFGALLITRSSRAFDLDAHNDVLIADEYSERIVDAFFVDTVGVPNALFLMRASEWRMRNRALAAAGLLRDDRLRISLAQCTSCAIQIGYGYHEPDPIFLYYETKRTRIGAERRSAVRTRPVVVCRHCARRRMHVDDRFVDRVFQAARRILGHDATNDDLLVRATLMTLRDDRIFDIYVQLENYHVFETANPPFYQFVEHMTGTPYSDDNDCLRRIGDDADRYISAYHKSLHDRYARFLDIHREEYESRKAKKRRRQ
jgi:hypothetical protein